MLVTIECYSPEGFKITLNKELANTREALDFTAYAARVGFTPTAPDLESHKTETIVTVVRRQHIDDKNVITPVIDMYPAWKGDYGQFRFAGVYLNTAADIEAFEGWSGLDLESIPLYAGEVPIQRKATRVSPYETACRPFVAHKQVSGEKVIDGVMQKVWKFAGYAAPTVAAPVSDGMPSPDIDPFAVDAPAPSAKPSSSAPSPRVLPQPGTVNQAAAPLSSRTPRR